VGDVTAGATSRASRGSAAAGRPRAHGLRRALSKDIWRHRADHDMTAYRNWSAVTIAAIPAPPPPWPNPDLNLLQNFSFAEGTSGWTVSDPDGAVSIANSRLPRDTRYLQPARRRGKPVAKPVTPTCSRAATPRVAAYRR
jgi:hypothetical protein